MTDLLMPDWLTNTLLIDSALRATVVLASAWIAASLLRYWSADLRHRIWLAALAGVALSLISLPVPESFRIVMAAQGGLIAGPAAASSRWPIVLAAVWAVGMLLLLARFGIGLVALARLTRAARRFNSDKTLISDAVATPMTWGVLRPVILLPAYMAGWPPEKRESVILHEQAHVDRHDWVWQTFAQVVTAVFWFHPLVWFAAAQLRREAERAADDRALAGGIQPAEYAGHLLEVARQLRGRIPEAAIAMVREPVLSSRIRSILDPARSRTRARTKHMAAIATVSALLVVSLAAAQSQRIYSVAEVSVPPRVASKIEPKYTAKARTAKIQGTVVVTMVIKTDGHADNIHVARSLDKGLDANAVSAIKKWSFEPAMKDGKRVPVNATIEVNFKLL
jgi:TonB family protein